MKTRTLGRSGLQVSALGLGCMGMRDFYLQENLGALAVVLTDDERAELNAAFPAGLAAGDRYPTAMMAALGR